LFFLFVRRCQLILNCLQNPWTHLSLNLFVVSNSGKSSRTICFIVAFIHLPVTRWFFARRAANHLLSLTSCSLYFPFCWYLLRIRFLCDWDKFLYLGYSSIHLYIVRGQIRSSRDHSFTVSVWSFRFRHFPRCSFGERWRFVWKLQATSFSSLRLFFSLLLILRLLVCLLFVLVLLLLLVLLLILVLFIILVLRLLPFFHHLHRYQTVPLAFFTFLLADGMDL